MKRLIAIVLCVCSILLSCSRAHYVGEYKNGKFHGQGTWTGFGSSLGGQEKYVGEWRNGKYHGQGTQTFGDGRKYVGEWKDYRKHGQGTQTYADGWTYVGEWKNDRRWNGVWYKASGGVAGTYSNGKLCAGCKPDSTQIASNPGLPTLTIKSAPSNAATYIDNSYKGTTELTLKLPPGYYSVSVETEGYNAFNQRVHVKENMVLWATLKKKTEPKPNPEKSRKLIGTGTGFVVNKNYIVTAEHVVDDCNQVSIRYSHANYKTQVVAKGAANDLGLLRLERTISNTARLRGGKAVRLGERFASYGYPLYGELSDSAKITEGNINSLAGLGNDSSVMQFDAPTQPGNSGGPVLDSSGNVVGVVSHGLSKKYADQSGHIAQNVNFAVKSYLVEGFLSSNNVSFEKAESMKKTGTARYS